MNTERAGSLKADEEAQLQRWKANIDNPDMKFFEDGEGGYLSANEIEQEIRSGTNLGRELVQSILNLPEKVFKKT